MAKNTVRAFAYEKHNPGTVLSRTNEVITAQTKPTEFITLLYVLLDMPSGTIKIASAGHPPAFTCNGYCSVSSIVPGTPLGAFKDAEYPEATIDLQPDQSLILYTDGLTDARSDSELFGEDGIGRIASDKYLEAQKLAEKLARTAKDFAGGRLPDPISR